MYLAVWKHRLPADEHPLTKARLLLIIARLLIPTARLLQRTSRLLLKAIQCNKWTEVCAW